MADEVDMTAERDEREAPARLAASRKPYTPPANGRCFWCKDLVAPGLRYCDDHCRDDHANSERLAKIGGKR